MAKINNQNLPSEADVIKYEMLTGLLSSVYNEMKELSKKKPEERLNEFKIKSINRILVQIKELLKGEPTNEFLEPLDSEILPSNSDSVLVIGQFNTATDQFKKKYYAFSGTKWRWSTKENPAKICK